MASDGDHKRYMEKKNETCRLFAVDLTPRNNIFRHDDHPVKALGGETRANKASHNDVHGLERSASKSTSSAQGFEGRVFHCRYCSRKFDNSKERAARKSNPILHSETVLVGQQPTQAVFASKSKLPHNFELQTEYLFNNQRYFDQWSHKFHAESASSPLTYVKRARNDIELASNSLLSLKRAINEDPEQHNTTPGCMVTLETDDVELDLSLHL